MYILHCVFTAYLPLTDVKPRLGEPPDCSGETFTFELGLSDASACLYLAPVLEYEPLETDTEPDSALVPGPALSLSRCLTCEFVLWPLPGVERKGEQRALPSRTRRAGDGSRGGASPPPNGRWGCVLFAGLSL